MPKDNNPNGGSLKMALDGGWVLEGVDGAARPVRLMLGETALKRSALGLTIGRHDALCELLLDDPTVSRRHFRIARGGDGLTLEDLYSLNATRLDGAVLPPFRPIPLSVGQTVVAGHCALLFKRLPQ